MNTLMVTAGTLSKCFTDLVKLFSINFELDFINIAMLFSFSLDSDNYFLFSSAPLGSSELPLLTSMTESA